MTTDDIIKIIAEIVATAAIVLTGIKITFNLLLAAEVMKVVSRCRGELKEIIDEMYNERRLEINESMAIALSNSHSITGLREIMSLHDTQLRSIGSMQPLVERQTEILDRLTTTLEQVQKEMGLQNVEIAKIQTSVQFWREGELDRRQHPR